MIRRAGVSAAIAALTLVPGLAHAQEHSIIRSPGDHPPYIFEAEPQILVGYAGPYHEGGNFGIGFRGAVHIVNGFVPTINDSVAVGFGFDFATHDRFFIPIVLQWNFWLSTHWSVFGEPGIGFGSGPGSQVVWPVFFAGGRFHFTDRIALTLRVGYPEVALGVSFLL
jgi:hypothetical protein